MSEDVGGDLSIKREAWLDWLRFFAIAGVVGIHVGADKFFYLMNVDELSWWIANIVRTVGHFGVPMFFMISGALLLKQFEGSAFSFYKKRLAVFIVPLLFWNAVYFLYFLFVQESRTLDNLLKILLVSGSLDHLWYMPAYMSVLIFVPAIAAVSEISKSHSNIVLAFYCLILVSFLSQVSMIVKSIFSLEVFWWIKSLSWYLLYFYAGYYIDKNVESIRATKVMLISTVVVLTVIGMAAHTAGFSLVEYQGPIILAMTICIFILARKYYLNVPTPSIVLSISKAGFGIYLVHWLIIQVLLDVDLSPYVGKTGWLLVLFCATFFLSYFFVRLLQKNSILARLV